MVLGELGKVVFFYKIFCMLICGLCVLHMFYIVFSKSNDAHTWNPMYDLAARFITVWRHDQPTLFKVLSNGLLLLAGAVAWVLYWKCSTLIALFFAVTFLRSFIIAVLSLCALPQKSSNPHDNLFLLTLTTKKATIFELVKALITLGYSVLLVAAPAAFLALKKKRKGQAKLLVGVPALAGFVMALGTPVWVFKALLCAWDWVLSQDKVKLFRKAPSLRKFKALYKALKVNAYLQILKLNQEYKKKLLLLVKELET